MQRTSVLTLRLDSKLRKKLDRLSLAMSRSRSFVAAEAIREYVELNDWQISEIKKALVEADNGDFASDREVSRTLRKWTRRAD
jgi:predicted transcriptional regulator